jgi:hypothetical protein
MLLFKKFVLPVGSGRTLLGLSFAFLKALELPRHPEMITSTQS